MCQGMYFNDYYFGNGLYFIGAFLMNTALICWKASGRWHLLRVGI